MNRRLLVAVLAGVLVVAGLGAIPVAGQSAADADTATIDDALADATGEQTVIVRLTDPPEPVVHTTASEDRPATLQARAAETRSAFERFADGSPHIRIDRELWLANALVVTIDTDRVPLERLGTVENVDRVHENHRVSVASTTTAGPSTDDGASVEITGPENVSTVTQPSLTATSTTHSSADFTRALESMNVPSVFERGNRGDGVRVAVLDTGVNPNHPDIEISDDDWVCYDDCLTDGPHDVDGHGTHVSGTVVGGNANDAGLQIGVAPNATLMHAKVLNSTGGGSFDNVVRGMQWAVNHNADVISMSLGTGRYTDDFVEPIRNAQSSGTIVVAAVGNGGAGTSSSPGNSYDAISVGSVNVKPSFPDGWRFEITEGTVSPFSGGERIHKSDWTQPPADWPDEYVVPDVTAPGSVIWSADTRLNEVTTCGDVPPTSELSCKEGTSMAAPHVAGTIALIESNSDVQRSPVEIRTALETTAVSVGANETRQGHGRIDAYNAVSVLATRPNFIVNITNSPTTVTAGDNITINYTVENTGIGAGSQDIIFEINGSVTEIENDIELNTSETESRRFSYQTGSDDTGIRSVSVKSDDSKDSRQIYVNEDDDVEQSLNILLSKSTATADQLTTIVATVTNNRTNTTISGAAVTVPELNISTTTDDEGKAIVPINATAGEYRIRANAENYLPSNKTIDVRRDGSPSDAVYEPDSITERYDMDNNGRIEITELGAAGAAYANNELSITELGEIGASYAMSG